jgi:hypothetical protein
MARAQTLSSRLTKLIKSGTINRTELAERCGKSVSTVQRNIPANLKRTGNYTTGRSICLTFRERAVMEGGILGDGTLIKNPRGAAFEFDNKKADLIDWVAVELDRLVARDPNERYVQSRPVGHYKDMFRFRTATWEDLETLRAGWYQGADRDVLRGQARHHISKRIPDGFRLKPLSGLLWYLGDGCLVRKSTRETSQVIHFSTHCFPLTDLRDRLKPQLVRILRCESNEVVLQADPRVAGYPLYGHAMCIPARYVPRWLRFIGPCPETIPSYQYKWDYRDGVRRRWLSDELDLLREYWGRIPHVVICTGLGVTYEQARYAAQRRCGIHKGYSNSGKPLLPSSGRKQQFRRDLRATK